MKCKKCGCCCRNMIVEIEWLDIVREPKLGPPNSQLLDGHGKIKFESDWEKEFLLACGKTMPCPFLKDNLCTIYPTRPNVCVAMEAGSDQCRLSRGECLSLLKGDTK